MQLINTNGLAFLGPGSEWFWTALQFLTLAITFTAIYRQLRGQRVQIQDNLKLLRSQAHYNALLLVERPWELMITTAGLANVVNVGLATPEALSVEDWMRCSSYMFMQFNGWEYLYYQSRDGSIPKELWVGAEATFRDLIERHPGYGRLWSESQGSFDDPFRSYVAVEFTKRAATEGASPHVSNSGSS